VRGKGILIAGIVLLAAVGVTAIAWRHRRAPAPEPARTSAAAVISGSVITLQGPVRPQHVTGVGTELTGTIDAFLVDTGEEVFQGQALARVGTNGLESAREAAAAAQEHAQEGVLRAEGVVSSAMVQAARADTAAQRSRTEFERVQKAFTRQQTLLAAGATPRLVYNKAEQDFENAQADLEIMQKAARAAHEQVDETNRQLAAARKLEEDRSQELRDAQSSLEASEIQSPVDGLVVGRNGELGRPAADAGNNLFQIATDLYALEVPLNAPAAAANRIHAGQPALVMVLDLQSAGMEGTVKSVEGSQVVVEFTSALPALRPGMRADVRLKLD
jgi:multidrug resistance efflux pump